MINYMLVAQFLEKNLDMVMITVIALVSSVLMVFVGYKLLQMLQLTGYKLNGFVRWLKETKYSYISRLFMLSFLSIASMLITNVLLADFFVVKTLSYFSILFYFLFSALFITNLFTAKQKTPLKYTKRMTRLVIVYLVLVAAFTVGLGYLGLFFIPYLSFGIIGIVPLFLPGFVFLAYYITYPLEKLISNKYLKKAKKKLNSRNDLIVIGITGSYGKTTVKNILNTILQQKYKVCSTPSSFNTPLGLSKTILSNLTDNDQIFIAEMGAKQRYDIQDLCNMVEPKYGIITGVGNQHYLTFGSEENIIKTKAELAEYVSANNGSLYINVDGDNATKIAEKFENAKLVTIKSETYDLTAKNINTIKEGSTFELCFNGETVKCKTILLGEHNISNILLASRVALDLGLSLKEIAVGIEKLVTIPHRLEIVRSTSKYTIIDDAYNSSVEGSKASLDVISKFDGKKFVITPGIVELGSEQYKSNYDFGVNLAKVCDFVIIDSSINFEAISKGLLDSGFDQDKIIQTVNLKKAVEILNTLANADDVVLFENDLPDNYS